MDRTAGGQRRRRTRIRSKTVGILATAALLALSDARNAGASAAGGPATAADLQCALWRVDDGSAEGHSRHLGCTGLYSDFLHRTISPAVEEFAPGYVLWSDGAAKTRWIYLPPGTQVDTGGAGGAGTMDGWIFPVGTRVWKEFVVGGRVVETRFLWKRSAGWFAAVYVWSADGSLALEYTGTSGLPIVTGPGEPYEIPAANACVHCHAGSRDTLLGFEAVSLASEHASGLDLDALVGADLLTAPPSQPPIVPGDADAEQALGWLHANCGTTCHNARGRAKSTGLFMRLQVDELAGVETTATWRTAVAIASTYQPPPGAADCDPSTPGCARWKRIEPAHPNESTVVFRAAIRDPYPGPYPNQMPPLVTHRVPNESVAVLARWISSLPAQ